MSSRDIPERDPLGDRFSGVILRAQGRFALALAPLAGGEVYRQGDFIVRYGVRYLGKPHLSLVPGLVVLDYGATLTGDEAWEFLLNHSTLHPRADVVGYRNDGVDDMVAVKYLDPMAPVEALVYADAEAAMPLASVSALIAAADADVAPRIREYLPQYATLAEWEAALHE